MSENIRLVLVDDHPIVRRGIRSFLESFPDLRIVGEAGSGEEALQQIESWLPDVVIMDLLMPGGMDGVEAIRQIRALTPHTQVVALTSTTDDARAIAALKAGAISYVRKGSDPKTLLAALRGAARGQAVLDPAVASAVLQELSGQKKSFGTLSEREQEVLRLIALGRTNRQIAEALVIGEETIKTHVGNILAKLHLTHRMQAAFYALKNGLVSLDEITMEDE
jgi:NarL family two-component system response regulator LiaR